MKLFPANSTIREKPLPYLPPQVELDHLHANEKLLTDAEIEKTIAWFKRANWFRQQIAQCGFDYYPYANRYKVKSQNGEHYTVLEFYNETKKKFSYYAIYYGQKKGKLLGAGPSKKIKIMQDLQNGEWCALKIIRSIKPCDRVANEKDALQKSGQLKGSSSRKQRKKTENEETNDYIENIGMPLFPGFNLLDFLTLNTDLSPNIRFLIARNTIKAVLTYFQLGLLHCDIKLENFIIDPVTHEVFLIDLECSLNAPCSELLTSLGTRCYLPDELYDLIDKATFFNPCVYSEKTDAYSLGIVLGDIFDVTGFAEETKRCLILDFANEFVLNSVSFPNARVRQAVLSHLHNMTSHDPQKRPTHQSTLNFFEFLLKTCVPKSFHKKIGILNIQEYAQSDKNDKTALISSLKEMNEVWLIDCESGVKRNFSILCRELADNWVKIGYKQFYDERLNTSAIKILTQIPTLVLENKPLLAQRYFYITTKTLSQDCIECLKTKAIETIQASNNTLDYQTPTIRHRKQTVG